VHLSTVVVIASSSCKVLQISNHYFLGQM
jgi:hypothetical protein